MVALVLAELPDHELGFFNSWPDGMRALSSGDAQAVVLLRPVSVRQIQQWARERRQMPPKSTYFFPKPRTGMVFRDLDAPSLTERASGPRPEGGTWQPEGSHRSSWSSWRR